MIDGQPERLGDLYYTRDYPVLLEVGRWVAAGRPSGILRPSAIAESLGRDGASVIESISRLRHAGYLEADHISAMGGGSYVIRQLTDVGLRECGAWPSQASLAEVLKTVLEREAREADSSDPARGRKIRAVLDALGELGISFSAKLAAELLKSLGGIP
jgi:Iron dependent repressor, N-terminal DNA binding domain